MVADHTNQFRPYRALLLAAVTFYESCKIFIRGIVDATDFNFPDWDVALIRVFSLDSDFHYVRFVNNQLAVERFYDLFKFNKTTASVVDFM
jgi:hypothetical protein